MIGGLPYFGRMLATLLRGDGWEVCYLDSAGRRPGAWIATAAAVSRADLVYLVGGQIARQSRPDWLVRLVRCPVVMHWVGSDVTYAISAASKDRAADRLIHGPVHWAEVPWTAAELRQFGIEAAVVPLTSTDLAKEVTPLPKEFTVLSYLPGARAEFYGRDLVIALARAIPEASFLVAGSDGSGVDCPDNVKFLGWVSNMQQVYARSSVLLRMPEHDGQSFMVLEALAAGRHAIWNHEFDGVLYATSQEQARSHLERLLSQHRSQDLRVNTAGRDFIEQSFSPEAIRSEILGRFASLIRSRPGSD
jgi:hypothetical protein